MKDYRVTTETRRLMEDMISGRHPVKDAEGNEYYVRYNENTEELEEIPAPGLRPLTDGQKAEASGLAAGLRPQKTFGEYLAGNLADIGYGAKKALSGFTLGGSDWLGRRLGMDMSDDAYLSAKDAEGLGNVARAAGFASELGGNVLGAGMAGKAAFEAARPFYNAYQIGRAYDRLQKDPFQGSGRDVITRMKNHNGENVMLQRGEAIRGENGKVLVHGKLLQRETGTQRNYGLNKSIYKHNLSKAEVTKMPRMMKSMPSETTEYGQHIYTSQTPSGEMRLVTKPVGKDRVVSSMYINNR